MHKYASAEERAAKKTENNRLPYWFYGESIRTSVHGSHIVTMEAPSRNAIVGTNMGNIYACDNKSYIDDV